MYENQISSTMRSLLDADLPIVGSNSTINITNMAVNLDTETQTLQTTITTLTALLNSGTLSPSQMQTIQTLVTQLNDTYNVVTEGTAMINAVQSVRQLEMGNAGFSSSVCPAAKEGGVWAALQNCSQLLCRGVELLSIGNAVGGQVDCEVPNLYVANKTRFVTSVHYGCGTTEGSPELNATFVGSDVMITVSHKCLCPNSGGLSACSSQYRLNDDENKHTLLEVVNSRFDLRRLLELLTHFGHFSVFLAWYQDCSCCWGFSVYHQRGVTISAQTTWPDRTALPLSANLFYTSEFVPSFFDDVQCNSKPLIEMDFSP